MKKLKTGSREWLRQLKQTIILECPTLIECENCGRAIREGYVCGHCGCDSPGDNEINPEEYLNL